MGQQYVTPWAVVQVYVFVEYTEEQVLAVVVLDPEFDPELEELDSKTQSEPLKEYPSLQDVQSALEVLLFPVHVLQPVGHCLQDVFDPLE